MPGKRKSWCGQHLAQLGRHVIGGNALLPMRCDDIAGDKYTPDKIPFQGLSSSLQPDFFLRRGKDNALRRNRFGLAHFDLFAGPDASIGALQTIEADQF